MFLFPNLRREMFQGGAEARLSDNVVLHKVVGNTEAVCRGRSCLSDPDSTKIEDGHRVYPQC